MTSDVAPETTPDPTTLGAQHDHWERTFGRTPGMFGAAPSSPARVAADVFAARGAQHILELGAGQGRDTLFFADHGFVVDALDYADAGLAAVTRAAAELGITERVRPRQHDVRVRFPFPPETFDACYAHMLLCMALTTAELAAISAEVLRVLRPGGAWLYTVRTTDDPHYRKGIHRGEDLYENDGFIVHFFDRSKVGRLAQGFRAVSVECFEEGPLPRRLFRVLLEKP